MKARAWARMPGIEVVEGDAFEPASVAAALEGCWAAYYLIHSMGVRGKPFEDADRKAARIFAEQAKRAGVSRLVYLGGLGSDDDAALSKHLRSRREVERVLAAGGVPVTTLRAAMIIGSGSASFEILRYLVDRLPVMTAPRWVTTPCQPIAIRNVLEYLVGVLEVPRTAGQTYEIGGPEVVTYRQLMDAYSDAAGLPRRKILRVPVLTPRLSSYWIHLVTPAPASLARPLAEGLRNPVVCKDLRIRDLIPQTLLTPREAIQRAVDVHQRGDTENTWTDAGLLPPAEWAGPGDPEWTGGTVLRDTRSLHVAAPCEDTWGVVERVGGAQGWYFANGLWKLRGRLDRLVGGPGLSRGRRDASRFRVGDSVDFWRVVAVDPGRRVRLGAEMRLPGDAYLEFEVEPNANGSCRLHQRAWFYPRGLGGILYWYLLWPGHVVVFSGMARAIRRRALKEYLARAGRAS